MSSVEVSCELSFKSANGGSPLLLAHYRPSLIVVAKKGPRCRPHIVNYNDVVAL